MQLTTLIARLVLVIAAAAGSACTSSAPLSDLATLDSTPLCCADSRQIPIPGTLRSELRASLTAASPVFLFSSGRSRAYGFELPEGEAPYEIQMRALPMGTVRGHPSGGSARSFVFPALLFLDGDRKPIADESEDRIVAECVGGFSCDYSLSAQVAVPPGARYAVLHTLYARIGVYYTSTPQAWRADSSRADAAFFYPGRPREVFGQFGVLGDVVITVRKPPPPPPAEKPSP
jgi:hypothetical protein